MTLLPQSQESLATACFNFYGLSLEICSPSVSLVEELRRDFSYFLTPAQKAQVQVRVQLLPPPYPDLPSVPAARFTVRNVCFRHNQVIYLDYFGQGLAVFDRRTQQCDVYGTVPDVVHEIVYLFVLSTVGRHLDNLGIHRVHALGMSYHQQGILLLLPSGGGKSTMAVELLRQPGFFLLSEDTPLIDRRGFMRPFPLRLGVRPEQPTGIPAQHLRTMQRMVFGPKTLIDIEYFQGRVGQAVEPHFLFVGQRHLGNASAIIPLSRRRAFSALLQDLVIGRGVYQGREFLCEPKFRELRDKGKLGIARVYNSLRLLARTSSHRFILGRDIEKNRQTLIEFLQRALDSRAR
ncbi:MAG: hypothetical protein HY268_32110 [Deltaproteobacteria bacterium]|nr:hypothetical protein [Deltaproteobacteria bacterium]